MSDFKRINNYKELVKEKGEYYPYIMQIMGAPVINGTLITMTDMKYFYSSLIEGVFQTLSNISYSHKNELGKTIYDYKVFPTISKKEFRFSMEWALSDLFYDGCDLEDFDEEKAYSFFDREERYPLNPDDRWCRDFGTRKKYGHILID